MIEMFAVIVASATVVKLLFLAALTVSAIAVLRRKFFVQRSRPVSPMLPVAPADAVQPQ